MVEYPAPDISPDMSFLEMLDVVNERLTRAGEDPIASTQCAPSSISTGAPRSCQ